MGILFQDWNLNSHSNSYCVFLAWKTANYIWDGRFLTLLGCILNFMSPEALWISNKFIYRQQKPFSLQVVKGTWQNLVTHCPTAARIWAKTLTLLMPMHMHGFVFAQRLVCMHAQLIKSLMCTENTFMSIFNKLWDIPQCLSLWHAETCL